MKTNTKPAKKKKKNTLYLCNFKIAKPYYCTKFHWLGKTRTWKQWLHCLQEQCDGAGNLLFPKNSCILSDLVCALPFF